VKNEFFLIKVKKVKVLTLYVQIGKIIVFSSKALKNKEVGYKKVNNGHK